MRSRLTRGTALVLPAVLLTGMLALAAAAGAAVVGEDPCAVASPPASAEPTPTSEPTSEPTVTSSPEPTVTSSPEPAVEPSDGPTVITSPEPAPVVADPASAPADPTAPASAEPTPPADSCVDPSAEPQVPALMSAGPPVLEVVPDPHALDYGDAVPQYTFTLLDMSVTPPTTLDPVTLSPLVLEQAVLDAYVPPVCSTDHEVVLPPADTDSEPTTVTQRYVAASIGVKATSVAESPLAVTCTGGVLEGYTFDVTATAELTIAKLVTEVASPPTSAPISYGQTLHDSTLTGGSASVVGGEAVAGYFSFPLDSWSVTPLVGTQNHVVAFVPEDFANYEPSTTTIDVTVGTATPVVVTPPTASTLVTGQTLGESTLTGGVASTEGTFAFTTPTAVPADGTSAQQVTFTPADQGNFGTSPATTVDVDVTVAPAPLDYATDGYLGRVAMGTVTNLVRPRVMVPLAFTVTGGGAEAGDLAVVESFDPVAISCEAIIDNPTEAFGSVAIGRRSRLVYDTDNARFVQFWKVPVTRNTCYRVTTTITDGDTIVAYFKTR